LNSSESGTAERTPNKVQSDEKGAQRWRRLFRVLFHYLIFNFLPHKNKQNIQFICDFLLLFLGEQS